eukprot:TRINITY_DN7281_c0_g1_i1.p1 TRINITY_DN7281_c0_g1~~TRINITY_DN7281_c0_g1_i1.p1  ORF type:complete len:387 (+),score=76.62 TRINITY_DN7281_c0_g1_i1:53-1213(+)
MPPPVTPSPQSQSQHTLDLLSRATTLKDPVRRFSLSQTRALTPQSHPRVIDLEMTSSLPAIQSRPHAETTSEGSPSPGLPTCPFSGQPATVESARKCPFALMLENAGRLTPTAGSRPSTSPVAGRVERGSSVGHTVRLTESHFVADDADFHHALAEMQAQLEQPPGAIGSARALESPDLDKLVADVVALSSGVDSLRQHHNRNHSSATNTTSTGNGKPDLTVQVEQKLDVEQPEDQLEWTADVEGVDEESADDWEESDGPVATETVQRTVQKLGGLAFLDRVGKRAFELIRADSVLRHFFRSYSRMELFFGSFFAVFVFDRAEDRYDGLDLKSSHRFYQIRDDQYERFCDLVLDAFRDCGVSDSAVLQQVINKLAHFRNLVVTEQS